MEPTEKSNDDRPRRNCIAVASAGHARPGRDRRPVGFILVGLGRGAPAKRIAPAMAADARMLYFS